MPDPERDAVRLDRRHRASAVAMASHLPNLWTVGCIVNLQDELANRLTLDEHVVAPNPADRAEDEKHEPHRRHLALGRDGLPVELDHFV